MPAKGQSHKGDNLAANTSLASLFSLELLKISILVCVELFRHYFRCRNISKFARFSPPGVPACTMLKIYDLHL